MPPLPPAASHRPRAGALCLPVDIRTVDETISTGDRFTFVNGHFVLPVVEVVAGPPFSGWVENSTSPSRTRKQVSSMTTVTLLPARATPGRSTAATFRVLAGDAAEERGSLTDLRRTQGWLAASMYILVTSVMKSRLLSVLSAWAWRWSCSTL